MSRKYSAIRVATKAARSRSTGGASEVGDDDDGAGETLGAEVVLDELADLAAALADQGDHRHRGVGAAGDHRQQGGLADAGAGHDRDALAATAGHERVEGADAEADLPVDPGAAQRRRGGVLDRDLRKPDERRTAVERAAEAVDHAAEELGADGDR